MKILNNLKIILGNILRKIIIAKYRILGVTIGNNVFISHKAKIDTTYPDLITIDDNVYITHGCCILSHDHSVYRFRNINKQDKGFCHLKKNCFIGVNAVIIKNVIIGMNSIVAAGSVVVSNVPDNCVVAGNPAKVVSTFHDDDLN